MVLPVGPPQGPIGAQNNTYTYNPAGASVQLDSMGNAIGLTFNVSEKQPPTVGAALILSFSNFMGEVTNSLRSQKFADDQNNHEKLNKFFYANVVAATALIDLFFKKKKPSKTSAMFIRRKTAMWPRLIPPSSTPSPITMPITISSRSTY